MGVSVFYFAFCEVRTEGTRHQSAHTTAHTANMRQAPQSTVHSSLSLQLKIITCGKYPECAQQQLMMLVELSHIILKKVPKDVKRTIIINLR